MRNEWAQHAEDVIANRMRLAYLNKTDALKAIPLVVELMGDELKWSSSQRKEEISRCTKFMEHFGGPTTNPNQ